MEEWFFVDKVLAGMRSQLDVSHFSHKARPTDSHDFITPPVHHLIPEEVEEAMHNTICDKNRECNSQKKKKCPRPMGATMRDAPSPPLHRQQSTIGNNGYTLQIGRHV